MAKRRKLKKDVVMLFLLIIILVFVFGFYVGYKYAPVKVVEKTPETQTKKFAEIQQNIVKMKLPAVDRNGNGVLADLTVKVRNGDGLILVNINDVLADLDTQNSARKAAGVASDYTGISLENLDVIYEIETESKIISGTSAGAAMSVATIFALQNKQIKDFIIMTGTIDSDGNMGQVAGIYAKAKAAKESNLQIFLVPPGQSQEMIYKKEESCREGLGFRFCTVNYVPETLDVGKELDITVVEVKNIEEALAYFK